MVEKRRKRRPAEPKNHKCSPFVAVVVLRYFVCLDTNLGRIDRGLNDSLHPKDRHESWLAAHCKCAQF